MNVSIYIKYEIYVSILNNFKIDLAKLYIYLFNKLQDLLRLLSNIIIKWNYSTNHIEEY